MFFFDLIKQPPPKIRTNNLLDRQRMKVNTLTLIGDFNHQLL